MTDDCILLSLPANGRRMLVRKLQCVTVTSMQVPNSRATTNMADNWLRWKDGDMTVTVCVQLCRGSDTTWAVVNGSECACAQVIDTSSLARVADNDNCGDLCPGDPFQFCGGGSVVVYARVGKHHRVFVFLHRGNSCYINFIFHFSILETYFASAFASA